PVNPLDLPGPHFLAFYTVAAAVVLGLLYLVRAGAENGTSPRIDTADPYLITYLRGGANEALRVATVSLIDRGLLVVDGTTDEVSASRKKEQPRRHIEQALIRHFEQPHAAISVFGHPALVAACAEYERYLKDKGLLPSSAVLARRAVLLLATLALLVG